MGELGSAGAEGAEAQLIRLLRLAYSGERAAALAYAGHAKSVSDPVERTEIERIRAQELDHRDRVGRMLVRLGASPSAARERVMWCVGTAISLFCHVGGWFAPMYGAGRLERRNIVEYEEATRAAWTSGHVDMVEDLTGMAEVEWDHEKYFREKAASHWLWRWFPKWDPPGPREEIRGRLADAIAAGFEGAEHRSAKAHLRTASPAAAPRRAALVEPTLPR